jgi:hypothetical protein
VFEGDTWEGRIWFQSRRKHRERYVAQGYQRLGCKRSLSVHPRMVRTISTPRWPLVATVRFAALVTFFEDPRVCLGGAVVAESVIMMGRGKKEALKEEMPPRVHVLFMIRKDQNHLPFSDFAPMSPPLGSSLHCTSGVKRPKPTNHVGRLNKRWEENLACEK